jgi:hypothetical protein
MIAVWEELGKRPAGPVTANAAWRKVGLLSALISRKNTLA